MYKANIWLLFVLLAFVSTAQDSEKKILIRYATAHVGNGEVIENAYLAFQGKEITLLADGNKTRINVLDYDSIVDMEGKHIYPGFIIMDSRLGLTEIGAVRATHDFDETGEITPMVRTQAAFNAESKIISTVRSNGVLMAQVAPAGGMVSGTSSCMQFNGDHWQQSTVKADEGVFVNWPSSYKYKGWWAEPGSSQSNKRYKKQRTEIREFFADAKSYSEQDSNRNVNLKLEAAVGLFDGSKTLYVRANWAKDILDAIQFYRASGIESMCIVGGDEAHMVTTELKENKIPVIIARVHKLPAHPDGHIMQPYELAGQLSSEGIEIAFSTSGDMEAMMSRNLPFQVGTAVHHGLDYEKGIESLTLTAAKILGIENKYGTVQSGKRATFFISEGDALDMVSNKVIAAFIDGVSVDLRNHQTALYKKYKSN